MAQEPKKFRRPPDEGVIGALNRVHGNAEHAMIQLHPQEAFWSFDQGYPGMAKKLDGYGKAAHDVRHKAVRRIVRLGGMPEGHAGVDDPDKVFNLAQQLLDQVLMSVNQAAAVVRGASPADERTLLKLTDLARDLDKEMHDIEKQRSLIRDHGANYLLRKM